MSHTDPSTLRMIDANLNRAREGLRVAEDCARFVLDDQGLSERCKALRHRLRTSVDMLGLAPEALLACRDTEGDVGTSITTPGEQDRGSGQRDVVQAACKRAQEALRVIEECAKTLGQSGAAFEAIRYALYTLEQRLVLALRPPCPQWSLCVLVTESLCQHHDPAEIVRRAAGGGARCIQIREKEMGDGALLEHAGRLTEIAHALDMHVMINDRAHIAQLVGADGVHLGLDDLSIEAARALLGPRFWIGRTCPNLVHAIEAIERGADTCGIGPVFASATKAKPMLAGLGLVEEYLRDERTRATPVLAISGISHRNVQELAGVGCPGVAVSSAVCASADPESVCRAIVDALGTRRDAHAPTIGA